MSRKPAHFIDADKRTAIWHIFREKKPVTVADLAKKTQADETSVKSYLKGLLAAEYIVFQETNVNNAYVYILKNDVGIDAPRVRTDGSPIPVSINQEIWRACRILKHFNIAELQSSIARKTSFCAVKTYLSFLARAGYLESQGSGVFLFVKYTGPKAPQIQRTKSVFDPNIKQVVYSKTERNNDD